MSRPRLLSRLVLAALLSAPLVGVVHTTTAPPAGAQATTAIDVAGRGWGHGRGMGQYGALGYAIDHNRDWEWILDHYYGGTSKGALSGGDDGYGMSVRIMDRNGVDSIITGSVIVDQDAGSGAHGAVRVVRVGAGQFRVDYGENCAGGVPGAGWTAGPVVSGAHVSMRPSPGTNLKICMSNGTERAVYGTIRATEWSGAAVTVNDLPMSLYLRGVVPYESPSSWGDITRGAGGMQALRAQAVAARSYSAAENRYPGVAKTCDTTACQVYGGIAAETTNANRAVADTAGVIRTPNGAAAGTPARTEFSSSTGGHTAGGAFPAVPDAGDSVANNPNHTWKASIPASYFEAKWPGRGRFVDLRITSRNGLGADGGRVTSVEVVFEGGTVNVGNAGDPTVGGEAVRGALGLKSDWFTIVDRASFPYHVLTRNGAVYGFGGAAYHGGLPDLRINTTAIDIAEGPGGYWIMGHDGGIFSFNVPFHGSMGGKHLNSPVVGMSPTAAANGYWLVAADGGIFSFGDAPFFGSTGNLRLNKPVVGMAPTPSGRGYWLVASDGGIFAFGDAPFYGSTGNIRLNKPIVGMAPTTDGGGYWLVASDGGLFAFGNAGFHGSLPGAGVSEIAVEMVPDPSGNGYLIATSAGRVWGFGSASSGGGPAKYNAAHPTVAAARPR